jgi:hypothetical protein
VDEADAGFSEAAGQEARSTEFVQRFGHCSEQRGIRFVPSYNLIRSR